MPSQLGKPQRVSFSMYCVVEKGQAEFPDTLKIDFLTLTVVMLVVVTSVTMLVHLCSTLYMSRDMTTTSWYPCLC